MKEFFITLNNGRCYQCRVSAYKLQWSTPANKNSEIYFTFLSEDFNGDYKYVWSSLVMQGLSCVYKGSEKIYDPYSNNNSKEGNLAETLGRELSIEFLASMLPYSYRKLFENAAK